MDNNDKNDILGAINTMSTHIDARFDNLEKDVGELKKDVVELKEDVGELKKDVVELKKDVGELKKDTMSIKAVMVTKDYLDDKLADTKGDIILTLRKEDVKVGALVAILREKHVLGDEDVQRLLSMEPFPKLYL